VQHTNATVETNCLCQRWAILIGPRLSDCLVAIATLTGTLVTTQTSCWVSSVNGGVQDVILTRLDVETPFGTEISVVRLKVRNKHYSRSDSIDATDHSESEKGDQHIQFD